MIELSTDLRSGTIYSPVCSRLPSPPGWREWESFDSIRQPVSLYFSPQDPLQTKDKSILYKLQTKGWFILLRYASVLIYTSASTCSTHANRYFCDQLWQVCWKKEETAVPVYLAMFSSRRGYFVSLCVSTGIMSFSCSLRQCRLLSASCNANTSILILHLLYFPSGMAR